MVFAPPRYGKSELLSRRLPAYFLGHNPDACIIAGSYSADLASRFNRDVQRIIDRPEYARLFPQTRLNGRSVRDNVVGAYLRNSDIFEVVGRKGVYRGAGVGVGITGMGFDLGILDDVIKDDAEANSLAYRNRLWDWYRSTFYTRQEKDAAIVLTLTRWHEDDIAGRLLKLAEDEPDADQWTVISIPAIAEHPIADYDPRQEGELLWENKFDAKTVRTIQTVAGAYRWNALYQQRPKAPEGNKIKRSWLPIVPAAPAEARKVKRTRYWDKGGTQDGGAYTAGVLLFEHEGMTYIEDVVRGQWSAGEREAVIKQTAELDAQRYKSKTAVSIYVEQEPGSGGKESADNTVKNLKGFKVYKDRPSGDKDTRLEPFAAQAEAGNVRLLQGQWNYSYIEEMVTIPFGKYRDQGDATAGAFNKHSEMSQAGMGLIGTAKVKWG
jgi:predicted phage terminase large subunit-like protein